MPAFGDLATMGPAAAPGIPLSLRARYTPDPGAAWLLAPDSAAPRLAAST